MLECGSRRSAKEEVVESFECRRRKAHEQNSTPEALGGRHVDAVIGHAVLRSGATRDFVGVLRFVCVYTQGR